MLFQGLVLYPTSDEIFQMLLELGCDPNETAMCRAYSDMEEEEELSLLAFVLTQPPHPAQAHIVHTLIEHHGELDGIY